MLLIEDIPTFMCVQNFRGTRMMMPIKIGKKTFKTFDGAVRYIIRRKKFSEKFAKAYVASIERKQKKR